MMLTTPTQIETYRICTLYQALKLETLGMRHSRGSAYATIKKEFGLKGSKESVLKQFLVIKESRLTV